MHPRPKAQRRGKAGQLLPYKGKGGGAMYKSCKLANKSREGEEREDKLIKDEERWGEGAEESQL